MFRRRYGRGLSHGGAPLFKRPVAWAQKKADIPPGQRRLSRRRKDLFVCVSEVPRNCSCRPLGRCYPSSIHRPHGRSLFNAWSYMVFAGRSMNRPRISEKTVVFLFDGAVRRNIVSVRLPGPLVQGLTAVYGGPFFESDARSLLSRRFSPRPALVSWAWCWGRWC